MAATRPMSARGVSCVQSAWAWRRGPRWGQRACWRVGLQSRRLQRRSVVVVVGRWQAAARQRVERTARAPRVGSREDLALPRSVYLRAHSEKYGAGSQSGFVGCSEDRGASTCSRIGSRANLPR